MSELLKPNPKIVNRVSRRRFLELAGLAAGGIALEMTLGCTESRDPAKSVDQVSPKENEASFYSISDLRSPGRVQELDGKLVRTAGYLKVTKHDISYKTVFGIPTLRFGKNVTEEVEDITYEARAGIENTSDRLYMKREIKYGSFLGNAGMTEKRTEDPDAEKSYIITGKIKHGKIDIGGKSIETDYLEVQDVYIKK